MNDKINRYIYKVGIFNGFVIYMRSRTLRDTYRLIGAIEIISRLCIGKLPTLWNDLLITPPH
jgi:hypothetical protein